MSSSTILANEAWKKLIDKYDILNKVKKDGIFHIKASEIKEFKEPRLMAKWDCNAALPSVFKINNLNILPDSRSSYILGDFLLYEEIPELTESVNKMDYVELPEYETIDVNNVSSEANAINILILSGILDDFLEDDGTVETFNGRMGTGEFEFVVDTVRGNKQKVSVKNAQCEIDGGFENDNDVIIMEAKNVINEDFHVRQLYYPFRLWKNKVTKPIRLIFSIYSNMIFRLFEYKFVDENDYSSIKLVKTKNYSLQDTTIEVEDLIEVRNNTPIFYKDNQYEDLKVPFIQANSFERVISLLENMKDNPMTTEQIAELMEFDMRQSDYYYNAGAYIGLFEKKSEDKQKKVFLTKLGEKVFSLNYKQRQLKFVELILQHQIFADCFDMVIENGGEMIDKKVIENMMREYNVCNEGQIVRRASSVQGWLKWIFNLRNL
ncbi:MAG: type II restriction enzyme [Lachnoanaerobaculum saburreum]